jgi:Uma2 family endonuclease
MSTVETTRYTPEDLLTMPGGERYELVDGHLVEKPIGGESDWIGMRLIARLVMFVETGQLGHVFGPETGYQCFRDDPHQVRKPDGSFIAAGRLPGDRIPKGHIRVVPDLVIEVVSPNDLYYAVEAKVREYQEAGVRLIWVLNPDLRSIKVYERDSRRTFSLSVEDELTGGDVVPGFRCPVSSLFPAEKSSRE